MDRPPWDDAGSDDDPEWAEGPEAEAFRQQADWDAECERRGRQRDEALLEAVASDEDPRVACRQAAERLWCEVQAWMRKS